jgi:glycosyltransferase involved in cell wall biosynthesis
MKVSILIPTLNRLDLLRESLHSARLQAYPNVEILVSDDGSEDGSQLFVKSVEREDPRVHLLERNPRRGIFSNIDYLVGHSSGDAFTILADDDRLLNDFVAKLTAPLLEFPDVVASFCDHWIIDNKGALLRTASENNSGHYGRAGLAPGKVSDPLAAAMTGSMCLGFSLYRSSVFKDQRFDLSCGGSADFDYAIRAAQLGKLYYVSERLGEYRYHPESATVTRTSEMAGGIIRVFEKYSFSESRHEKMRKRLLRRRYLMQAAHTCTIDARVCMGAVRRYTVLGGSIFNPRIILAIFLLSLPSRLGNQIKVWMRQARTLVSRITGFGRFEWDEGC